MLNQLKSGLKVLFERLPRGEVHFHHLILLLVLGQLLSSFFIHIHADTPWSQITATGWYHMVAGLTLTLFALLFFAKVYLRRGSQDLYPWLGGHWQQIIADLKQLKAMRLPEPVPGGLAATVEGLGLLALLLAVATGALWFVVAQMGFDSALLLSIHKTAVGAIELYFYGHGGFALLHLLHWWRQQG